jgi:hypothetical protein
LKADWQRHVLASSGYLELGMLDDAAMVLEEIAPEDKTRNEVPEARALTLHGSQEVGHGGFGGKSSGEGRARRSRLVDQFGLCDSPGRRGAYRRRFATVSYRLACCRSSRQRTTSLEHSRRVVSATLELSCFQETSGEHRKIGLTVEIGFPTRCRPV